MSNKIHSIDRLVSLLNRVKVYKTQYFVKKRKEKKNQYYYKLLAAVCQNFTLEMLE